MKSETWLPILLVFTVHFVGQLALAGQWSANSPDVLTMKLGAMVPSSSIEVKGPPQLGSKSIQYKPNVDSKTFLGFGYRNLGVTVGAVNPPTAEADRLKGATRSTDFQIRFFGKNTYELAYQSYHGYYVENSQDIDSSYAGDLKIQRPDLSARVFSFNYFRNFDDKDFSQAAAFDQNGRQVESGWGRLLMISGSHNLVTSHEALVPQGVRSSFSDIGDIQGWNMSTLSFGGGLGGVFTGSSLYATGLFGLGLGYQKNSVDFESRQDQVYEKLGSVIAVKLGLGYNGKSHVFGGQYFANNFNSQVENGELNVSSHEVSIFYAYRFDQVNFELLNGISSWFD